MKLFPNFIAGLLAQSNHENQGNFLSESKSLFFNQSPGILKPEIKNLFSGFEVDLQLCTSGNGISPAAEGIANALSVMLYSDSGL